MPTLWIPVPLHCQQVLQDKTSSFETSTGCSTGKWNPPLSIIVTQELDNLIASGSPETDQIHQAPPPLGKHKP